MQQLIQQKGFQYRAYFLREDDMIVHLRDLQQEREFSVDYIDLGLQFYRKAEHKYRLLGWLAAVVAVLTGVVAVVAWLFGAAWSFSTLFLAAGISGSLSAVVFAKQKPAFLHLIGGEHQLAFLAEEPSEDALNEFLEELCKRIKDSYQNQYLDEKLEVPTEERRSRIQWLHQMKVLTRSEKDVLLAELGGQQSIGFKRSA
ncbi:MAG: hypothetical protein AAFO02_22245 [Bacteroidota bacterium]